MWKFLKKPNVNNLHAATPIFAMLYENAKSSTSNKTVMQLALLSH